MKVLIYAEYADNAGVGIALKQAFDRYSTDWQARFVRRRVSRYGYPADIEWRKNDRVTERIVRKLIVEADVIHLLQWPVVLTAHKPTIVHHLGTYYRRDPQGVSAVCESIGATQVVGGLDLVPLGASMDFLPLVADCDAFYALRMRTYTPSRRIRIAHAPTNRGLKSTDVIQATVERLAERYPVDLDIIEGVSWDECLKRKARADIFVDELTNGYGANTLEAWSMGIPVVSGIADPRVRELMEGMFGGLPFMDATPRTLYRTLETLVIDSDLRQAIGMRGWKHVRQFHSGEAVVSKAISIYERAIAQRMAA